MEPGAARATVVAVVASATASGQTALARATGTNRCCGESVGWVPEVAGSVCSGDAEPHQQDQDDDEQGAPGGR